MEEEMNLLLTLHDIFILLSLLIQEGSGDGFFVGFLKERCGNLRNRGGDRGVGG